MGDSGREIHKAWSFSSNGKQGEEREMREA